MSKTALTKKQLALASKMFSLATIAMFDDGGCDTDEESNVLCAARDKAREDFWKAFPELEHMPTTIQQCIEFAKRLAK